MQSAQVVPLYKEVRAATPRVESISRGRFSTRALLRELCAPGADGAAVFRDVGGVEGMQCYMDLESLGLDQPQWGEIVSSPLMVISPQADHRTIGWDGDYVPQLVLVEARPEQYQVKFPYDSRDHVAVSLISAQGLAEAISEASQAALFTEPVFELLGRSGQRRAAAPVQPQGDTEYRIAIGQQRGVSDAAVTMFVELSDALGQFVSAGKLSRFDLEEGDVLAFTGKTWLAAAGRSGAAPNVATLNRSRETLA